MTSETLIRLPAVMERTGCKRSKIYEMINRGDFPEPLKLDGCALWPASAVDAWISDRVKMWRRGKPKSEAA